MSKIEFTQITDLNEKFVALILKDEDGLHITGSKATLRDMSDMFESSRRWSEVENLDFPLSRMFAGQQIGAEYGVFPDGQGVYVSQRDLLEEQGFETILI